jgi:hypothetical protein
MAQKKNNVYFVYGDRLANAQNRYIFSLFNNTTDKVIELRKLNLISAQVAAITGVLISGEFKYIDTTAPTAGTDLTIQSREYGLAIPSGIIAKYNPSTVADAALIRRYVFSGEEQNLTELALIGFEKILFEAKLDEIGLILPAAKGVALKNITSDTVATYSYLAEFLIYDK